MVSRRVFLAAAAASTTLPAAASPLRIGTMDGVFRMQGKPESVALAKKLGLASVQVTLGRSADGATLPLEDVAIQNAWRAASKEHQIPLTSTYIDQLHAD